MIQQSLRDWRLGISGVLVVLGVALPAIAQLIPDRSLGAESSIVTPGTASGLPSDLIEGGAQRGSMLFHSFRDFNIGEGGRVYFSNPASVQSIFTRVTGTTPSNILGTLGVNGTANLFLLNPNGILFGSNARLDIQGSFVASSADRLVFNNGFAFSATSPQTPPLLTISTPIGLQYGNQIGEVRSQGASLQVPNGQTLSLIGGNVAIEGGELLAPGGRVELAGVAAAGEVGLRQQGQEWRLSVPDRLARADVSISNDAIVDVSSGGGGSIAITARNLTGTGFGTRILAGIAPGLGTVEAQAGDIDINATEAINLAVVISNRFESGSTGKAGNVNITTGTLSLTNGAQVSTPTFGQGNAGNVTITARDTVSIDGVDDGFSSSVLSSVQFGAIGEGGNININTRTLSLTNGGGVNAGTLGQGNAGNVTITARDSVSIDGVGSSGSPSAAGSQVGPGVIGEGGNVSITTGTLSLTNGGIVTAATFGQGNAGDVTITAKDVVSFDGVGSNGFSSSAGSSVESGAIGEGGNVSITTGTLSLTNGGIVTTAIFGQGNAGNITITASDAVSFDGVGSNGLSSGAFSSVESGGIGQGRTIAINTERFSITNGARLTVSSEGQGAAGDLEVTARQLRLDNQGSIQAQTASGKGGNITLQVPALLLLRRGSFISTTAGTAQAGGDGGNIILNSNLIVAVPQENSNISANAFTGRGGNIRITTQGLFGIEPRASATTGLSSITASSQFGISGTITLNRPDVDPNRGLVQLPTELQDTSGLIAGPCPADKGNSFTITGRGGLPEDPRQPLMGDSVWLDDRAPGQLQSTTPDPIPQIVEAQGWIRDRTGQIMLVPTPTGSITQTAQPIRCDALKNNH